MSTICRSRGRQGKKGNVIYIAKHIEHIKAWRKFKRQAKKLAPANAPKGPLLAYPFMPRNAAGNADLISVNALVPRGIPGREDVCQSILLAILEGKPTAAELSRDRSALQRYIRGHIRESFELNGYAVSLDMPLRDGRSLHEIISTEAGHY